MNGPDFVCIGAVKAGTQWLYDQVRAHPGCWMTPIKELHYFNSARYRAFPPRSFVRTGARAVSRGAPPAVKAFYAALNMCEGYGIVPEFYHALFAPKGNRKSGDVSPGYCQLDPATVETMVRALPETKFLYIARDPVERAWSDISMLARHGSLPHEMTWCESALHHYLGEKRMRELSYSSRIVKTWAAVLPPERFRIFFFDVTRADPAGQRRIIMDYIGLDPARGTLQPNVKAGRAKLDLTPSIRAWLERFFAAEREAFNRLVLTDLHQYCAPASLL